jgi:hypothetical protein
LSDSLEDRIGRKKLELFSGAALFSEIESSVCREAEIGFGEVVDERNASCDNPRALKMKKLIIMRLIFTFFESLKRRALINL